MWKSGVAYSFNLLLQYSHNSFNMKLAITQFLIIILLDEFIKL